MTVCLLLASASAAFASDEIDGYQVRQLNKQEEEIVLRELSLDKAKLTEEERIALLTKGTAVVWNKTYKNEYSVKKVFL